MTSKEKKSTNKGRSKAKNKKAGKQIIVRGLTETVHLRVRSIAADGRISMEEWVRRLVRDAVAKADSKKPEKGFGTLVANHFKDCRIVSPIEEIRGQAPTPASFG